MQHNGILIMQSTNPKFIQAYADMLKTTKSEFVSFGASASIHTFQNNQLLVISSGYLIQLAFQNNTPEYINQEVQFAIELKNNQLIPLRLIRVGTDNKIAAELQKCYCDSNIGAVLFLEFIGQHACISEYASNSVIQGDQLSVISSPFGSQGSEMYRNCVRKACVAQTSEHLFLLDMISQSGQEGGSVYNDTQQYVGMLLPSTQIQNHNNRYYTFAIEWSAIMAMLNTNSITTIMQRNTDIIDYITTNTCYVTQNSKYGSGTLIHDKCNNITYVLTVRHILVNMRKDDQLIIRNGANTLACKLIESCDSDIDFCIAKVQSPIKGVPIHRMLYQKPPYVGQLVYAVGYSLYHHRGPMISRGHVVKLIYDIDGSLIALMTDCYTHNGYSGGGVFDAEGTLIGLISFNISQKHEGMICDMNFAYSTQLLENVFEDLHRKQGSLQQQSKDLFSLQSKFIKQMTSLQTRLEIPTINYKPKL